MFSLRTISDHYTVRATTTVSDEDFLARAFSFFLRLLLFLTIDPQERPRRGVYIRPDSGIRIHVAEYTVQMPSVAAKGLPPGEETIFQGWINDLRHGCLSTDTTASHRYIWEGKRRSWGVGAGGNAVPRYDRRKDPWRRLDDNDSLRESREGKKVTGWNNSTT